MHWPQVPLTATGFALSLAFEPFPQKLAERIRSDQYVDMRDLLTDNISLLQQLETVVPVSMMVLNVRIL